MNSKSEYVQPCEIKEMYEDPNGTWKNKLNEKLTNKIKEELNLKIRQKYGLNPKLIAKNNRNAFDSFPSNKMTKNPETKIRNKVELDNMKIGSSLV